ncbi:hypothetical protein CANCADRAFT_90990 [Tortispora caseinolytica NRRL Y-17796]|uniref:Glutamate decarboxylase n=1 Tax=Tortispora caseinolytica NRRL Y-17796 TaxID=767744 RepID=A0A1E4TM36_9ASCO|nr:hypothetical protein CANCADRAFT_90990 [Tortispora caseinolytica NRRL Y-17796]
MLHKGVDPNELIKELSEEEKKNTLGEVDILLNHQIQSRYRSQFQTSVTIPRYVVPEEGVEPEVAYRFISSDLDLDGKPGLNCASFVNTYCDDNMRQLTLDNLTKNLSDVDEYPAMMDIHARCISFLSNLWHAPSGSSPIGSATTGSSEAIHLGGLAMKQRWRESRQAAGKDVSKPNIIMGANAQVALEKFARYFDVEARLVPVCEESHHCLDLTKVKDLLDENTIGVFCILGSTYTGHFEPVEELAKLLDEYEAETGIDIPIHVDGASGAFIAPFVFPDLKWDFSIPRVVSINTSGHKFGLATAGLGWIVWRDESFLPKYLVFELKYLGGVEQSFTLNFSRPGFEVIQQYYLFLTLGREGFKYTHSSSMSNARLLSRLLELSGYFEVVSDIHRKKGDFNTEPKNFFTSDEATDFNYGLPVVAFKLSKKLKADAPYLQQEMISQLLRAKGYIIPNYPLPPSEGDVEILRVVVRQNMSADLVASLVRDAIHVVEYLYSHNQNLTHAFNSASHMQQNKHHKLKPIKHPKGHRHGSYRGTC